MAKILQKNNLGDHIPEPTKKTLEDQAKRGNSHALISINCSPNAWILDLGASHHMGETKNILSFIYAWTSPHVLMGDDTPVEVIDQGRV